MDQITYARNTELSNRPEITDWIRVFRITYLKRISMHINNIYIASKKKKVYLGVI